MESKELERMYLVEDHHWWYLGLREMLSAAWRDYAPSRADCRLLDIGCGTGANLRAFAHRADVTGVDYSTDALRWCQQRGQSRLASASTLALPIRADFVDVVISCDVLCHLNVPDVARPLREIHRVLKPGGVFLLNLPAYQWLSSSHDTAVLNARRFTRSEIVRALRSQGFEVLRATYWNTLLFPPALCVRLWRKFFAPEASDLASLPTAFENGLCGLALALERRLLQRTNLPIGLSIFVVARKHK